MQNLKFQLLLIIILGYTASCNNKSSRSEKTLEESKEQNIIKPEFQLLFDSTDIDGSILIYDYQKDLYYSNNFEWANKGNLPASTFKIANSIIAIETGVVEDDSTMFEWNGEKRMLKNWEQDLILKEAFHFSCVPCYRDIARRIGVEKMNKYINDFNYGDMKIDSSNLDLFWLIGESRITQFEQIDFLKRFYFSELSISERTESIIKNMIVREHNEQYTLSGKTGLSGSEEKSNGWFVGYLEIKDEVYFFATNVEPKEEYNRSTFPKFRNEATITAFKELKLLE